MAINWTQATLPAAAAGKRIEEIAFNGARFVAVGDIILHSTDGKAWAMAPATVPAGQVLYEVVWTGAQFVAMGDNIYGYSSDGLTWTFANLAETDGAFTDLASNLKGVVIGTNSASNAYYSSGASFRYVQYSANDGLTFARRSTAGAVDTNASRSGTQISHTQRTRFLGGQFVSVGHNLDFDMGTNTQAICTSPDGLAWTRRESGAPPGDVVYLYDVAWNGAMYLATSQQYTYSSPSGVTWTRLNTNLGPSLRLESMAAVPDGFVAVTRSAPQAAQKTAFSLDGKAWSLISDSTDALAYRDVFYADNRIIAVGSGSTGPVIAYADYSSAPPLFWSNRIDCTETVR